ncbi:polysaccharide lyase family 8 super-sandwich domain-containing protein [Vibrio cincinnatiensis]|uniref:polysaccharide lyase family 8 super-sandwich domain-containing protein n=1 Tax=Vibrio cincinnatiensis TaxID=675 RepID=UPI001EE06582|nr:polysaccharide lyase family 8 super-sandwich domain-containing protein [Vibrio cincinnatiensis]MCG3729315.1 hypothetical protein [Vibrio cincinnatiensis]
MKAKLSICAIAIAMLAACNDSGDTIGTTQVINDDYDLGLMRYQELFLGLKGERGNSIYTPLFSKTVLEANKYNNSIHFDKEGEFWSDLPLLGENMHSTHFSIKRLGEMSQAYVLPGDLQYNRSLLNTIETALNIFTAKYYREDGVPNGNWYEWQIGIPQELMKIVSNIGTELNPETKDRIYASITNYMPSINALYTGRTGSGYEDKQTNANRVDMAWTMLAKGLMSKNDDDIEQSKKAFITFENDNYKDVTNALPMTAGAFELSTYDGFREDGSYVFHGSVPYSNGYGLDLINRAPEMLFVLNGTEFDFTQEEKDKILDDAFTRLFDSYLPWLKDGLGLDATAGRAVDRGFEQNYGKGQWAVQGLIKFYSLADLGSDTTVNSERKAKLGIFIKSFLTDEENYYGKFGSSSDLYKNHKIENYAKQALTIKYADIIKSSPYAYRKEPLIATYVFSEMDRVVHRREDFTFAISSHSYRTANFEIVGYEGAKGCYSADGMTYIYDNDVSQYSDYWVSFDNTRPAGVTNDGLLPDNPQDCSWSANNAFQRKSALTWSGGVADQDDNFGVFGLDYKDWQWNGSSLLMGFLQLRNQEPNVEAKKSWFMFDDYVLALGSDIKCNLDCSNVETTIDNKKLTGVPSVTIDGSQWGGSENISTVNYMHIKNNTSKGLGVIFPDTENINLKKEHRSGDWLYMSNRAAKLMDSTKVEREYLRTYINHGDNGNNSYAYILAPEVDKNYLDNNYTNIVDMFDIIENSENTHVVEYLPKSIFAMNIFDEPSNEFITESSSLILNEFESNNNANVPLSQGIADQILAASDSELFHGNSNGIKATGSSSIMYKLDGKELTIWASQPTRTVMSMVLDISAIGVADSVSSGSDNVKLSADGKKAVVKFDLTYIGTAMVVTSPKWLAKGNTYKFSLNLQ